ncbi:hypothetical protein QTN25_004457 [Entamoeba marina]
MSTKHEKHLIEQICILSDSVSETETKFVNFDYTQVEKYTYILGEFFVGEQLNFFFTTFNISGVTYTDVSLKITLTNTDINKTYIFFDNADSPINLTSLKGFQFSISKSMQPGNYTIVQTCSIHGISYTASSAMKVSPLLTTQTKTTKLDDTLILSLALSNIIDRSIVIQNVDSSSITLTPIASFKCPLTLSQNTTTSLLFKTTPKNQPMSLTIYWMLIDTNRCGKTTCTFSHQIPNQPISLILCKLTPEAPITNQQIEVTYKIVNNTQNELEGSYECIMDKQFSLYLPSNSSGLHKWNLPPNDYLEHTIIYAALTSGIQALPPLVIHVENTSFRYDETGFVFVH